MVLIDDDSQDDDDAADDDDDGLLEPLHRAHTTLKGQVELSASCMISCPCHAHRTIL